MGILKYLKVYLYSLFLQASWTFEDEQKTGFLFVFKDFLKKQWFKKIKAYRFNTNPYLVTFLIGRIIKIVKTKKKIELKKEINTVQTVLAAQGDTIFWKIWRPSLLIFATSLFFIVPSSFIPLILFLIFFNLLAHGLKIYSFHAGYFTENQKKIIAFMQKIAQIKSFIFSFALFIVGTSLGLLLFKFNLFLIVIGLCILLTFILLRKNITPIIAFMLLYIISLIIGKI